MIAVVISLFLAIAAPAPEQVESPADPKPSAGAPEATAKAEPDVVCTMEYVTGSRVKKQRVCKTRDYDKAGERWRDKFQGIIGGSGDIQPKPPPAPGVGG